MLSVCGLTKSYHVDGRPLTVLDDVSFTLDRGASLAIVGPSGSGKSTLLGLCAALDHPTSGTVTIADTPVAALNEDQRARLRNAHIGFVFQSFQLIPTLTALENVMVPLELRGDTSDARQRAHDLLQQVGLEHRANHYPLQLSGGEQQRTALARAFINQPALLFADEPTGNLDTATGSQIADQLFALNRDYGTTLVLVTHDSHLAKRAQRTIRLHGGRVA